MSSLRRRLALLRGFSVWGPLPRQGYSTLAQVRICNFPLMRFLTPATASGCTFRLDLPHSSYRLLGVPG